MSTRSCVVTGASGGIGSAIVRRLLDDGWSVVGVGASERGHEHDHDTGRYEYVSGDVAGAAVHATAAELAERLGPLRGWVNCAGYNILGSVAELPEDELRRGVDVDLIGYFLGTAEACRRFLARPEEERAAAIVQIGSIHGSVGFPGFAAYAMCKGGIEALSRQVAAEYVGRGIRCNVVAPGLIASPINDRLLAGSPDPDGLREAWDQLTPIGRWGTGADCAAATAFLLEPSESGFITGEVLPVNGGATVIARGQRPPRADVTGLV